MLFREINIDDKHLFNGFQYTCSDYVFSYLYMYSDLYKLKLSESDKAIIIRSEISKPHFYMPLGDIEWGIKTVIEYCKKNNVKPVFSKIPSSYSEIFKDFGFVIKEDRNSFDYIFRNEDLVNYEGKDYRKQRNNISNYLKTCTPIYSDDVYSSIEECKQFTLSHFKEIDITGPTLKMLNSMDKFDLKGGVVRDQDNIQAFCIYEKVSADTILSHIELTDNSNRGIHTYMINEMSKGIKEDYINKEDDMGLQGLRRFKESYNPYYMYKKYCAVMSCINVKA